VSTKAIREALARLEILMEEPPAGMSVEDAVLLNSARTEVEAIERAAMAIADTDDSQMESAREEFNQAVALMERIVEQAKAH